MANLRERFLKELDAWLDDNMIVIIEESAKDTKDGKPDQEIAGELVHQWVDNCEFVYEDWRAKELVESVDNDELDEAFQGLLDCCFFEIPPKRMRELYSALAYQIVFYRLDRYVYHEIGKAIGGVVYTA